MHWSDDRSKEIYGFDNYNLASLVRILHSYGFSIRLSCVMVKGYVDSWDVVDRFLHFCMSRNRLRRFVLLLLRRMVLRFSVSRNGLRRFVLLRLRRMVLHFCRCNNVKQFTLRELGRSDETKDKAVSQWVLEHHVSSETIYGIEVILRKKGTVLLSLPHGATIYDHDGQNVCLTNCLTLPLKDEIRQLIFHPDGHLRYDWKEGAILL